MLDANNIIFTLGIFTKQTVKSPILHTYKRRGKKGNAPDMSWGEANGEDGNTCGFHLVDNINKECSGD